MSSSQLSVNNLIDGLHCDCHVEYVQLLVHLIVRCVDRSAVVLLQVPYLEHRPVKEWGIKVFIQ
jgi:hypothetical protein